MLTVLVVDDEDSVRYSFKKLLRGPGYKVIGARSPEEALERVSRYNPDLVILDIQMPGGSGLEVLKQIKAVSPRVPVIVITAYGSTDRVITAMKYGAFEYIEKPFDIPRIRSIIAEALANAQIAKPPKSESKTASVDWAAERLLGSSPAINQVFKMIGRVAASDVSVLLVGESGTGKELVARALCRYSRRSDRPFLAVNCAAIPETLLESELFGYEKGAFTGATKRKIGKFQQADGGTLFLDEIADMSLSTQAKVLRLLQEGTFERLGGDQTIACDVRIIAATNQNLEHLIAKKRFREDLYYRIKVITITLPPLRLRMEDMPELIEYFLRKYQAELQRDNVSLSPEGIRLLLNYHWPGNVRELENLLKRAMLLCKGNLITPETLSEEMKPHIEKDATRESDRIKVQLPKDLTPHQGHLFDMVTSEVEKMLLMRVLKDVNGNHARAARLLGISRTMLHERVRKYGIRTDVVVKKN